MPKSIFFRSLPTLGAVALVAVCLGSCSKKTDSRQPNGQEVAHVGSDDITTSELQLETNLTNQQAPTDKDRAVALQRIAARKSLAQKAVAAGLDRQPSILLEIRRSKDQILANATAVTDVKKDEQKITLEQINAFIAAHPYQFNNRTLMQVDELIVPSDKNAGNIVDNVKTAIALGQVETYLTNNKIPFQRKVVELDTLELPDALSQALLKPNNIPVVRTPALSIFMQVKQTKPAPITGSDAGKAAKAKMVRNLFETEMSAPIAGDDVTYMPPYKAIIDEMKAKPTSTPPSPVSTLPK